MEPCRMEIIRLAQKDRHITSLENFAQQLNKQINEELSDLQKSYIRRHV